MSKQAFLKFRDTVMRDGALQAELVDTVKSRAELLAMGKRLGFEFDAADLESRELTDDDMKKVVGGATTLQSWAPVRTYDWTSVSTFNTFVSRIPK